MKRPTEEQRASALVLALIVAFVLSSLGLSLAMMAEGESGIARNERVAVQARYAAEASARTVKGWFDRPGTAVGFPDDLSIVWREREILDENDPYGPATLPGPEYKEGVDLDADGVEDLFREPFSGPIEHLLLGREDAPDLRIVDEAWLERLSRTLFGGDPDRSAGHRISVHRIDVFAPPYVRAGSSWVRRGMGTIEVLVGVDRIVDGRARERLAERSVRMVLREVPYESGVFGPLHTCGDLTLAGELPARWGTVTVGGEVIGNGGSLVPWGLPRAWPPDPRQDPLWTEDPDWIAVFNEKVDRATPVPDPWLRVIAGGDVEQAPSGEPQPFAGSPPPNPAVPAPWRCCDGSNVMQRHDSLECPGYDYAFWKGVATSGVAGARYFAWSPLGGFREDGAGPLSTFDEILTRSGPEALYFFDTLDARPPRDDDGDGSLDNLTPEVLVEGDWAGRGFVYLNARSFRSDGLLPVLPITLNAPGEPAVSDGTAWVDLFYPTQVDGVFSPGGPRERNPRGPDTEVTGNFQGILFVRGTFQASAGGLFYGSVVGAAGAVLDGASHRPVHLFWDASLAGPAWPPAGWALPRVVPVGVDEGHRGP